MNIKVIGSSSAGNCYRISDSVTSILIEAGLPIKKIKEGCDFDLPGACLITHEHGDHAKAAKDLMQCGVNVYATVGTSAALGIETAYRCSFIEKLTYFTVGTFQILPFDVHHDAAEPVGFLISSTATGERLMFMTDSYYTEYKFNGLTHVMIEANFEAEALGGDPRAHRLRRSHMSIENCVDMLKANDLTKVQEIWLLHLSSSNGDAEGFKRCVMEATGKPVFIA